MDTIAADPLAIEQLRGDHWFADRAPKDFLHAAGPRLLGLEVYTTPAAPRPGERDITLTAAEITHLRDHYDTGVTYADVWLGLLLAHVDLDDTLVIVLSDHGEDLLDHGFVNHRTGLWDSTLHVPLVVAGPGFAGTGVHPHRVDLRSVLPTVLRATGATLPAGVTAPALQDDPDETTVFAEGVMDMVSARGPAARLVLSDAKLAANAPDLATRSLTDGRAALYIEPAPVDTVASSAEGEALRAQIVAWRKSLNPATTTGAPVSEAIRAALRERGYWSPGEAPTP
jgi:arylsulfatase A-like enzyme